MVHAAGSNSNGLFLGIGFVIGALAGAGLHTLSRQWGANGAKTGDTACRGDGDELRDDNCQGGSTASIDDDKKKTEIIVPYPLLYDFCCKCLTVVGCSKENAETVAKVLLAADLRGISSHGIQRLHLYCFEIQVGAVNGKARPQLVKSHDDDNNDTPDSSSSACALVNGNNAQGAVVGCFAMDAAVEIAKKHGCAIVVCKNSNHYGIAGYYTDFVARNHGMLCLSMTNTSAIVVPTHSKESCLGTNPISLAAPTTCSPKPNAPPVLVDMATTTVPIGRVEIYQRQDNKQLPSRSWAVDSNGKPCTNPDEIINRGGAMLPLGGASELNGGHKGYCAALLVEMLCGVLAGGRFGKDIDMTMNPRALNVKDTGAQICHFFLVIDPNCEAFCGKSSDSSGSLSFSERVSMLAQQLRSLQRVDPQVAVRVPGDRSDSEATKRMQHGIPIHPSVAASLQKLSEEHNVELPFSMP